MSIGQAKVMLDLLEKNREQEKEAQKEMADDQAASYIQNIMK